MFSPLLPRILPPLFPVDCPFPSFFNMCWYFIRGADFSCSLQPLFFVYLISLPLPPSLPPHCSEPSKTERDGALCVFQMQAKMQDSHREKLAKMGSGDESAFRDLFSWAAPKFVCPFGSREFCDLQVSRFCRLLLPRVVRFLGLPCFNLSSACRMTAKD